MMTHTGNKRASDGLGSTTELVTASGGVTASYRYDPFGEQIPTTTSGQPFRFTGEQQDADVVRDPYYLRARYYDPEIGRFWSKDPFSGFASTPQSQNRYGYVSNRPVHLVDPWGLCGVSSFGDFGDCFEEGSQAVSGAVTDVAQCVTDVQCSQDVTLALDRSAATISGARALIANGFTAAGCLSTGTVGCLLGKFVGEAVAVPLGVYSDVISVVSTVVGCTGAFAGSPKEGGGFTRSNVVNCGASVLLTWAGSGESNIDAAVAGYQLCRTEGRCWP